MKSLLRKILSRPVAMALLLVLQIALIVGLVLLLYSAGNTGQLIGQIILTAITIFGVICFFGIIYQQTDAEFKIPWIVILMYLPIVGPIFYLIFKPRGLRKRDYGLCHNEMELMLPYFQEEKNVDFGMAKKTFDYITRTTKAFPTKGNKVHFFKDGSVFFPDLIEKLKTAKKFIFIEFFIIHDGEIWNQIHPILKEKAAQGVEVRLLYDDMGCLGTLPKGTFTTLRNEGIDVHIFNPFTPILSNIYNNRDHRKIVVIDHKYAYTGGMNCGDEYANKLIRFGYWKDTMIRIEGPAVKDLIRIFLFNFDLTNKMISNYPKYLDVKIPIHEEPGFVLPFGHGPAPIYKERVGEHTLINIIESATRKLDISSPYFIPSEALLASIRRAALNGVEVNLYLPGIPDKKLVFHMAETYFASLLKAGVRIHIYKPGFNHEKCVMADDKLAFVGTINMDYRSLVHHFECGAVLYNNPCLIDIKKDFAEMDKASELLVDFKMDKAFVVICSVVKLFVSLF